MNESHSLPSAKGVITKASPFSVAMTVARLEAIIGNHRLTLFAHIDHGGAARSVGLSMNETHVLIFGSPQAGTPLMVASPLLALELPLRALIWQGDDGQVWVSSTCAAYLQCRFAIPPELTGNIASAERLIEQALETRNAVQTEG